MIAVLNSADPFLSNFTYNISIRFKGYRDHFSAQARKMKLIKNPLFKYFLYFSKKTLIFRELELSGPKVKNSFIVFQKKGFSYILGNGTFLPQA